MASSAVRPPRAPRRQSTALLQLADHMKTCPLAEEDGPDGSDGRNGEKYARRMRRVKVAIEFINLVKEAVPQEHAKMVLSAVSTFLGLVNTAVANKEELEGTSQRCTKIGQLFLQDMLGGRETDMTNEAINNLNTTVESMNKDIRETAQRQLCMRIFSASIDSEEIQAWNTKLDRDLQQFQICAAMEARHMLQKIHDGVQTIIEQRVDIVNNPNRNTYQRDPPPPRPAIFCGREKLASQVSDSLLECKHIVLHGAGGIGKSTIAKVVFHQDDISAKFSERRFWIKLEESEPHKISFDTFMSRITFALGLGASKSNCQRSITTNLLSSGNTLMVFDSIDNFVDSPTDGGRIRGAIAEYQDIPSVAILITTSRRTLSYHPRWLYVPVPPLDPPAASDLFRAIYHQDILQDRLDRLLQRLDYHPLSVHLLAQAAWQNEWSPEELEESWEQQHVRLLRSNSENHSLNTAIAISLSSPAIQSVSDKALQFLQVVAFLPSGVDRNNLDIIFPSISGVSALADLLQQHSLVYRSGAFLTMLAPIRLYIMHAFNRADIPLLPEVRHYYYSRLQSTQVTIPAHVGTEDGTWIRTEDDNVEQLIGLDLSVPSIMERACDACIQFVQHLIQYKRRPTYLEALVEQLPEDDPKKIDFLGLKLPRPFQRFRTRVRKGVCVLSLGLLAAHTGRSLEALKLFSKAKQLFDLLEDWDMSLFCLEIIGQIHVLRGQMVAAEKALNDGLKIAQRSKDRQAAKAQLLVSLGWVKILKSAVKARDEFTKIASYFREKGDDDAWVAYTLNRLAYSALYAKDHPGAKKYLEEELKIHTTRSDNRGYMGSLMALAEVALAERELGEAEYYLEKARRIALSVQDTQKASLALTVQSAIAADVGDYALARSQIQEAIREVTFSEENENFRLVWCLYIAARNEFVAQDFGRAKELYQKTLDFSDPIGDVYTAVRSMKALGEIALLERDVDLAKEYAQKAQDLSESTGVATYLQDIRYHCCLMKNSFEGRRLYQEDGLPSVGMI